MAIQILPRQTSFGESLATGLGAGLEGLLNNKISQLQERNKSQKISNLLQQGGVSPALADLYSLSSPEQQRELLSRFEGLTFEEPQQQGLNILKQLQPSQKIDMTKEIEDKSPLGLGGISLQKPTETQEEVISPSGKNKVTLGASPAERRHREKLTLAEKKLEAQEKREAFKMTKDERKSIFEKAKTAQRQLDDLDRLEELEKEGKLDTPGYIEFLERSGFDIPSLMSEGSEEFKKIAANFIGGAKDALGGRVTNFELEQFLKTIPSLSQSPEGRKRVISNLKRLKRTDVEYKNALKEVIKENNGIPPYDLSEQIDEKIGKRLDKITEQFKEDLKREVPKGQNRLITALQTALGSSVGIPGALFGKVGKLLGGGGALELV